MLEKLEKRTEKEKKKYENNNKKLEENSSAGVTYVVIEVLKIFLMVMVSKVLNHLTLVRSCSF